MNDRIPVGSRDELMAKGQVTGKLGSQPVCVFWSDGAAYAVDDRCPHMGFPLHRGTVENGLLTCHWHHARFDLKSGCTFDPFADDAPAYETAVNGKDVFVRPHSGRDATAYWNRRLREGMQMNVTLVMVKAIHALLGLGIPPRALAATAGLYGAENRDAFGPGLVILTAMAHTSEMVGSEQAALALAQGVRAAANDAAGQSPHRTREPLERDDLDPATATRWMRRWTAARHRDGAERTLLTLLHTGADPATASDAVFSAITDRIYADGGHACDFANKAFELAELVGWPEGSRRVLPSAVPSFVGSRGAEESAPWHSPVDLVALLEHAAEAIPGALRDGRGARWSGDVAALAWAITGEDAATIVAVMLEALRAGATPLQLATAVAHAGALRLARFGTSNEFGDWDTALHTFTYSQAVHHALARAESPEVLRGVFHGAMSVYQDRFLNVPPVRLPMAQDTAGLPNNGAEICAGLLEITSGQGKVEEAACLAARYLELGLDPAPLLGALTEAVVREDAAFHTFQMLEAGLRLWRQWDGAPAARVPLIAVARYAAAHAPTQRAFAQTVNIVQRLGRGEALHEEAVEG